VSSTTKNVHLVLRDSSFLFHSSKFLAEKIAKSVSVFANSFVVACDGYLRHCNATDWCLTQVFLPRIQTHVFCVVFKTRELA